MKYLIKIISKEYNNKQFVNEENINSISECLEIILILKNSLKLKKERISKNI